MMSKKIRLLLVPLVLLASSYALRAQDEEEETEVVDVQTSEDQEPDEQEQEEEAEVVEAQDSEGQEPETEQEPEAQEEQPLEQESQESEPEQTETETEQEPAVQEEQSEEPTDPIKWKEKDTTSQSDQQDDTPEVAPVKDGEDEVMGIDTIDLPDPQGNWLYKRVWWERTEAKFERIREVVGKIMEVRTSFFAKRAELDKNVLDPFYFKVGMSQGELQEILKEMVAKADRLLASEKNDHMQEKLEEEKSVLQSLQKQVQVVMTQDEEVEKAILMLVEQITKVRNIEQQAWQDFKEIARVLDDRKARELFYKVDAAWRNIKELQQYIEQTFATSFDALIEKVKKEIERVDQEMNALKETGTQLQQGLLGAQQEQLEMEDEQDPEPKGFFTRYVTDPIFGVFKALWSGVTWPYRALFGATPADEDADEDMDDEAQEQDQAMEDEAQEQETPATEPDQAMEDGQEDTGDQEPEIEEEVVVDQEDTQE